MADTDREDTLLSVENLHTHVHTDRGTIRAVDGVDFHIDRGETVCLVGESGSGKSVTCESITQIVPQPPAEIVDGSITFDGTDLRGASQKQLRAIRGDRIAHVFQNPQHALDPVYTVGEQIVETIRLHRDISKSAARQRAVDLLQRVGIPRASQRAGEYPHQFSGGMQQRAVIAMALAAEPDLLIADEPTTSVDVTVQARLIELLRELADGGMAMLWVTHDLRVVAAVADRVLVMFGGTLVERGPVERIFQRPAHPYTQALFDSYSGSLDRSERTARGDIPNDGCRFRGECPHAVDACAGDAQPPFYGVEDSDDHHASCVYYGPERDAERVLREGGERRPLADQPAGDSPGGGVTDD